MRIFSFLRYNQNKVGELTIKYSNLPERYIKRAMEQVYYKNPTGYPQFRPVVIKRKKYLFGLHRPWTTEFHQLNERGKLNKKVFVEPILEWNIFKGDRVELMVGRDKGKQGIVSMVIQERNWVIVEGLNTELEVMGEDKKTGFPGVTVQKECPLLVTDEVKLVDPETLKPTDIEWRFTEDGEKVRVSLSTSRIIPLPKAMEETYDYKTKESYFENKDLDTPAEVATKITFTPKLGTFEMDIMESMGIKEDRVQAKTYWY